jgi:hypothetical protein
LHANTRAVLYNLPLDDPPASSVPDCSPLLYAIAVCTALSLPSSFTLFFLRVKAVYFHRRLPTIFFGFVWCVLLGLCFFAPMDLAATWREMTRNCQATELSGYLWSLSIANVIADTLVFIAISYRIMTLSHGVSTPAKTFFRGHGLSRLSKAILQGGQTYYLFVAFTLLPY